MFYRRTSICISRGLLVVLFFHVVKLSFRSVRANMSALLEGGGKRLSATAINYTIHSISSAPSQISPIALLPLAAHCLSSSPSICRGWYSDVIYIILLYYLYSRCTIIPYKKCTVEPRSAHVRRRRDACLPYIL